MDRQELYEKLVYSNEQMDEMRRVNVVAFSGFPIRFTDECRNLVSTKEGIDRQIEAFPADVDKGLVSYADFSSGSLAINRVLMDRSA